jgi:hypothetical protein
MVGDDQLLKMESCLVDLEKVSYTQHVRCVDYIMLMLLSEVAQSGRSGIG